mmetsp:Transcript_37112/g.50229  ORF Transcript_37112/g.50229 Transcript_37112/m.50229 type:complete len:173 (-) Transcript_37112:215-733(-)
MERKAAQLGGGDLRVPVQRVTDFLKGQDLPPGATLPSSSYRLGVTPARLDLLYPKSITDDLCHALRRFDDRMPGFVCNEGLLHGVETRTSAPVSLPRDPLTMECEGAVGGVYPAGEGAGHAGGIVSAAVDGMRVACAVSNMLCQSGGKRKTTIGSEPSYIEGQKETTPETSQ